MPFETRYPIELSRAQREKLRTFAEDHAVPERIVKRVQIVLYADRGLSNPEISRRVGISPTRVGRWRKRFHLEGVKGLSDRPRPGRPRKEAPPKRRPPDLAALHAELDELEPGEPSDEDREGAGVRDRRSARQR